MKLSIKGKETFFNNCIKEILKIIKNGRGMMPGDLVSDEEAKILVNWLEEMK
ncbi:c-type cytochrome [Bacillus sp. 1NLA3E]|uniref:c-type cytochrome n=1 Tax=Bacillus sp. 1NLA3E TaxID=666686 RepID=UPI000247ED62|nr:cytochrome c [Bacillus sp. 1NLA3E]AGK55657.1 hypothetical protein B1NLA3E_19565 [Bacillus sp. 1NLA3E]